MRKIILANLFLGLLLVAVSCARQEAPPPAAKPSTKIDIPPVPQERPALPPAQERDKQGAEVAEKQHWAPPEEKSETKESETKPPSAPAEKPTVLEAVGRALLKSFTSPSDGGKPPEAPAYHPRRQEAP